MGRKIITKEQSRRELWWDKYNHIYRLYPHLTCNAIGNGEFQCQYCGVEGEYNKIFKVGCTERTKPCSWCGQAPLCAPDCIGMRMIFSDPKVCVTGNPFEV